MCGVKAQMKHKTTSSYEHESEQADSSVNICKKKKTKTTKHDVRTYYIHKTLEKKNFVKLNAFWRKQNLLPTGTHKFHTDYVKSHITDGNFSGERGINGTDSELKIDKWKGKNHRK